MITDGQLIRTIYDEHENAYPIDTNDKYILFTSFCVNVNIIYNLLKKAFSSWTEIKDLPLVYKNGCTFTDNSAFSTPCFIKEVEDRRIFTALIREDDTLIIMLNQLSANKLERLFNRNREISIAYWVAKFNLYKFLRNKYYDNPYEILNLYTDFFSFDYYAGVPNGKIFAYLEAANKLMNFLINEKSLS